MFFQRLKSLLLKPIFKFRINYDIFNPVKWNWQKIKESLKIFVLAAILVLVFIVAHYLMEPNPADYISSESISDQIISYLDDNGIGPDDDNENGNCNVAGIELRGELLTYIPPSSFDAEGNLLEDESSSENIIGAINEAKNNNNIKAIIIEIDSYGGDPVAAEEVSIALKYAGKPTVAIIRGAGDSAAYYAATGAERIFASKNSEIGGIGVTMSYLENVNKNQKNGLRYVPLSSGKFKDTGNPDKTLSLEEKNLLMRDINIVHSNFIKKVADNRKLDIKKVERMADGSTMLGEMALRNGLIDQIGSWFEARNYLKEKIGEDVSVCW
jgi:protease-4